MQYRKLGNTGLRISALSLGSWVTFKNQAQVSDAVEMMGAAYEAGVNFFDNAQVYAGGESETIMGAALKELGWRRSSYLVSTKLFWGFHETPLEQNTLSRKYLIESMQGCLERLQLDHVDLLYCHRDDPDTPIGEICFAMHDIINKGQALYWGTSEWEPGRIIEALDYCEARNLHAPVVEQPVYNLLEQHRFADAYDAVYKERGYGSTTWSPLASGLLTGKYNNGVPEGSRGSLPTMQWLQGKLTDDHANALVKALTPLADRMGASLAQFAIAWCLQNPSVSSVITGASKVRQVHENMRALQFADAFTPELMNTIEEIISP